LFREHDEGFAGDIPGDPYIIRMVECKLDAVRAKRTAEASIKHISESID
jgi:hypothetical protein